MSFDFFDNPPVAYRLAPFWFWNDNMDAQEIVRQVREMAEKGVGGFFICARQGLEIPYLSEQWFHLVAVAIEAAQQHGLHVWLYDEYPYPSGMSGGEVTLRHPDARHSQLIHHSFTIDGPQSLSHGLPWAKVLIARAVPMVELTDVPLWSDAVDLAPYIGSVPAETIFQSTGLTAYTNKRFFTASPQKRLVWDVPSGRWRVVLFLEKEIENFKYYGTYVDPCHKEAVQTFLGTTHEQYARHFHTQFGQTIKGVFTDEVGLLGRVPWSARLPDFMREQHDEDIISNLPALFDPQDKNNAQIRYLFFLRLDELLDKSYHQQVSKWCWQHQLQYTTEVPSIRMTTQIRSNMPGGDSAHEKVGRSLEWILDYNAYNMRADPKIASSLARQLGAERAMIECFHSVGWSMTLQDAKWMLDRLAALGINFFVLHAFFYSISGLRKHDAPPSQFFQNPYWKHYRQLADYAGRLCYAMSQGEACNTVAVVHPVTSFWTHMGNPFQQFKYCGNDAQEERALERLKQDWAYLCKQLQLHQIGYDHLDPEILASLFTVEDGCLVGRRARYEVLILPPMTNLEPYAWSQIKAFLQAGGKVISVGLLPYECIEGVQQDQEAEMLQWFGLTASPRQNYWQEFAEEQRRDETKQAGRVPWTKGNYSAYFLSGTPGANIDVHLVEHLLTLLQQWIPPTVLLESIVGDRKSFLMHQRKLPDGSQLIFITHQEGTEKKLRLHLAQSPAELVVERLDIASGERTVMPVEKTIYGRAILLSFAPYESHLLLCTLEGLQQPSENSSPSEGSRQTQGLSLHAGGPKASFDPPQQGNLPDNSVREDESLPLVSPHVETDLASVSFPLALDIHQHPWRLTAQQDNILRFGAFHFALDRENTGLEAHWHEGQAEQNWPQVEVKPLINQCADLAATQTLPVQFSQSFGLPVQSSLAYPLRCWYQTSFVVEQLPPACKLMMDEDAIGGNYTCYLNGNKLIPQDFVPVFQHGFRQQGCEVLQALKQGINHLVVYVEAQSGEDGVCDPLYLSGPFGVFLDEKRMPTINEPPATGEPKSGVQEGYPYFAGTLCYTREVSLDVLPSEKTFVLMLRGWDQYIYDCVEILVNGHSLGVCCWSPYSWKGETTILREGSNEIEIRITNTLSGMLEGSYFDASSHKILPIEGIS